VPLPIVVASGIECADGLSFLITSQFYTASSKIEGFLDNSGSLCFD